MNIQLRRPVLLLAIVAAFLLITVYLHDSFLPLTVFSNEDTHACPITPPIVRYKPQPVRGRFDWSKIALRYPKRGDLLQLPREEPRQLPKVQHDFTAEEKAVREKREFRRDTVKAVFEKSWDAYKSKAMNYDELLPISGKGRNNYGGWAATLVDSLDTLYIMGMHSEFEKAIKEAVKIDFGPKDGVYSINVFETTIRHLGGLLSAYDLTNCGDKRLLDKALEISELLYRAYDTPNGMPITRLNPHKTAAGEAQAAAANAVLAELGSASLEFTRLSQLTGDMRFYDVIQRFTNIFDEQQHKTKVPGLWPYEIDARRQDLTMGWSFSLGAMADSAYEYFPKMFALLSGTTPAAQYERIHRDAMDAVHAHMLYKPMLPDNADVLMTGIAHTDSQRRVTLEPASQHLMCFAGGMLALSGRLFANDTHLDTGRKLTDGCVWAYKHSPLGIMPEGFHMVPCAADADTCAWNETMWAEQAQSVRTPKGFRSIEDPRYILRPEAIESVFYLYRITGDPHYQEVAWEMFSAIEAQTSTQFAYAALRDVTIDPPEKADTMESFWMAETLKYFYLVFAEPEVVSLDEFVFNTEAHPFRRPR